MAITDIDISEELVTNAPSIKYTGNEGPKSPQEEQMMMADAMLKEEYNKYVFDLLEIRPEATPMTLEEFRQMVIAESQMSGGQPLPQDPTKPVNPFQPKPTGPVLPDRQMAAYGGIMGMDGRRQYGLGSFLKKTVRKIIPNEVAEIAVKAAPFVAPFNPLAAAAMSGLGSFDQTGRIGSSLKSGLMTYGLGQGARYLGGAGFQGAPEMLGGSGLGGTYGFSSPIGTNTGIGKFLADRKAPADMTEFNKLSLGGSDPSGIAGNTSNISLATGDGAAMEAFYKGGMEPSKIVAEQAKAFKIADLPGLVKKNLQAAGLGNNLMTGLLVGGLGAGALMGNMTEAEVQDMSRGEGLDVEAIRTEVLTAMKDPTGEALKAIRIKYPFLGTRRSKNIDAIGKAMGGRIRRAEGGLMDLGGMEKDYRAEGGFVPIGKAEKADDVPARLSVNEFVFTADAVRNAGGGDIDKGAEVMENMMKNLEAGGQVSEESQGIQSLRAGGRAGFANGLTVDTDKVIEDIKKFSIPGLIGRGVKAGANKISDIDLETIIKIVAKTAPGGMVVEKVTEFLVDRYGMSPDEAQMKIVNKLGTNANEGFKQPSGTSDEGYRMVGIESSAEDTSDIPRINRLRNLLGRAPSIEMPRPDYQDEGFPELGPLRPFPERQLPRYVFPRGGLEFDKDGNPISPRPRYNPEPYRPKFDEEGNEIRPGRQLLKDMFNTSQRLSEVVG